MVDGDTQSEYKSYVRLTNAIVYTCVRLYGEFQVKIRVSAKKAADLVMNFQVGALSLHGSRAGHP